MEQHPWDAVGAGELQAGSVQCSCPVSKRIQPSIQEDPAPTELGWRCNRDFFKSHPSGVPLLTWDLVTLLGTLHPGEPHL